MNECVTSVIFVIKPGDLEQKMVNSFASIRNYFRFEGMTVITVITCCEQYDINKYKNLASSVTGSPINFVFPITNYIPANTKRDLKIEKAAMNVLEAALASSEEFIRVQSQRQFIERISNKNNNQNNNNIINNCNNNNDQNNIIDIQNNYLNNYEQNIKNGQQKRILVIRGEVKKFVVILPLDNLNHFIEKIRSKFLLRRKEKFRLLLNGVEIEREDFNYDFFVQDDKIEIN